jgi:hypothetical protein
VRSCRSAGRSLRSTRACTAGATVARYYDPTTGQFLTRDPLEDETGQPYSYADDDPIDNSDPSGMFCILGHNSDGSCRGSGTYDWSVEHLDPAYYAVEGYADEWQAAENGCSLSTVAKYGAEGVAGVAATGLVAVGGAGAVGDLLGNAADDGSADVTFGHGARHLVGTGLDQSSVESAIEAQVQQSVSGAASSGSFWGRVVVNGQTLEYRAFTLPDGTINVGTYYVVP